MRKLFPLIIVFLLVACNSNPNTITVAELTEREELILSTTSDQSFVFEFHREDDKSKELSIWMEKYESDKQIGGKDHQISVEVSGEVTIMITMHDNHKTQEKRIHLIIQDQDGMQSITFNDTIEGLEMAASLSGHIQDELIFDEEEVILGYVAYTSENSISAFHIDFYGESESIKDELKKYDVVYLIKAQIK